MKKWADMASLPQEFRDKIERLERNFAVSMVTFKKFQPIFLDIFENPAKDPPRPPKSRKQKCVLYSNVYRLRAVLSLVVYFAVSTLSILEFVMFVKIYFSSNLMC